MIKEIPLKESNSLYEWMFISNNVVDVPKARPRSTSVNPTNNVVVTFYTAILLTHYKPASSVLSLRFRSWVTGSRGPSVLISVPIIITSALRILALRKLRTLRVRTRAFGPQLEKSEKPLIFEICGITFFTIHIH